MKDQLNFLPLAMNDLIVIEKQLNDKFHIDFFYYKLATNICTLLRESALDVNKRHTILFDEKAIPNISKIKVTFSLIKQPKSIINIKKIETY